LGLRSPFFGRLADRAALTHSLSLSLLLLVRCCDRLGTEKPKSQKIALECESNIVLSEELWQVYVVNEEIVAGRLFEVPVPPSPRPSRCA
jgi:hypothetical protein